MNNIFIFNFNISCSLYKKIMEIIGKIAKIKYKKSLNLNSSAQKIGINRDIKTPIIIKISWES